MPKLTAAEQKQVQKISLGDEIMEVYLGLSVTDNDIRLLVFADGSSAKQMLILGQWETVAHTDFSFNLAKKLYKMHIKTKKSFR